MTRKDYIAIADALNKAGDGPPPTTDPLVVLGLAWGIERATSLIADVLETDNPRFDRERFLLAVKGG